MAKTKSDPNARRPGETYWQWTSRLARQQQEARDLNQPIVTEEAAQHGDYRPEFVTHVETGMKAHTRVNRGGGPVERWERDGKLDANQLAAIGLCLRLWRLATINPKVVANYGERVLSTGNWDVRATNEIEAREDLHRIIGYFPGPLKAYWDVFENVCRHGISAGVAGAALNHGTRSAETRAHQIVCFVADVVATNEGL